MAYKKNNKHTTATQRAIGAVFVILAVCGVVLIISELRWEGRPIVSHLRVIPFHYLYSRSVQPERITLIFEESDLNAIFRNREKAFKDNIITTTNDSYVPVRVRMGADTQAAQVRLKGDLVNHIQGIKWSLRFVVGEHQTLSGLRSFSIQDPKRSGYANEWILHKLYAQEGLIALPYDFVTVDINGVGMGIFALEGNYYQEVIVRNNRQPSVVLKYDESDYWHRVTHGTDGTLAEVFFDSPIDSFETSTISNDPYLASLQTTAIEKIQLFRSGSVKASEIFDINKVAQLYALADVTGSHHALQWKNVRMYYNPDTELLELIGYNGYPQQQTIPRLNRQTYLNRYGYGLLPQYAIHEYHVLFFQDPLFWEAYVAYLNKYSKPVFLDEFLAEIESELQEKLATLYVDYPWYIFDRQGLYENQKVIQDFVVGLK